MILTGKCLEDFESWYKLEFEKRNLPYKQGFDVSDLSIQYGVYVDFFDENGLYINISSESVTDAPYWTYTIDYNGLGHDGDNLEYLNRPEAREQAIIKANEIYNSL